MAGVHNATVSLALRNSPSISLETRQRIQAVAESLGYRPDPALRALVAYRKGLLTTSPSEQIAYVTHASTRWGWRDSEIENRFFIGAQRKAAECGYELEHFWLGEPGMTARRLSSVLFHRGITGVLLASQHENSAQPLDFEWDRISAEKVGCVPNAPARHRVTNDPAGALRLAMRQSIAAGYKRIGLVIPEAWDSVSDLAWSTSFAIEQNRLPKNARIPTLVHTSTPGQANAAQGFADWLYEFEPEVILGASATVAPWLAALELQVPQDVALVDLLRDGGADDHSGVRQHCERAGEVAAEILSDLLQRNVRGLPSIPTTTLVETMWSDGLSLPSVETQRWDSERASTSGQRELKSAQTAA
jgi:LacI family transcriptional regulator